MTATLNQSVDGEIFSNEDIFFRALIKGKYKKNGEVSPRAFTNSPDGSGTSVDWAKFSSPRETANRFPGADDLNKQPIKVLSIDAESIWECEQDIQPDPLPSNYSHRMIVGEKGDIIRVKLARKAQIVYSSDEESP